MAWRPIRTPSYSYDMIGCLGVLPVMIQKLIANFKNSQRFWVKNGEVFFFQLLNYFVAILFAAFYFSKSGQWDDVLSRLKDFVEICNLAMSVSVLQKPQNCRFSLKNVLNKNLFAETITVFMRTGTAIITDHVKHVC